MSERATTATSERSPIRDSPQWGNGQSRAALAGARFTESGSKLDSGLFLRQGPHSKITVLSAPRKSVGNVRQGANFPEVALGSGSLSFHLAV